MLLLIVTLNLVMLSYSLTSSFFLTSLSLSPPLQVCFNCRKPGHGLADCPEADRDEEMGREICYRCGSTAHEIQRCRAKIDPALGVCVCCPDSWLCSIIQFRFVPFVILSMLNKNINAT